MKDGSDVPDNPQGQSPPVHVAGASQNRQRFLLRLLLVGMVLGGTMGAVHFSRLGVWLGDSDRVRQALSNLGLWTYPTCALAVAVLVSCGTPRLLLCFTGGVVLGFWWGLLLTQIGTVAGYYGVFLFVRWGGRDWVLQRWPKLRRTAELMQAQGMMGVIVARQVPIHGSLINLALGLSNVKHRHFLAGTAVGLLTEAIPVTLIGAGLVRKSALGMVGYLAIAVAAFAIIWLACARALRKMRDAKMMSPEITDD